jgi:hypothetical protein
MVLLYELTRKGFGRKIKNFVNKNKGSIIAGGIGALGVASSLYNMKKVNDLDSYTDYLSNRITRMGNDVTTIGRKLNIPKYFSAFWDGY